MYAALEEDVEAENDDSSEEEKREEQKISDKLSKESNPNEPQDSGWESGVQGQSWEHRSTQTLHRIRDRSIYDREMSSTFACKHKNHLAIQGLPDASIQSQMTDPNEEEDDYE